MRFIILEKEGDTELDAEVSLQIEVDIDGIDIEIKKNGVTEGRTFINYSEWKSINTYVESEISEHKQ